MKYNTSYQRSVLQRMFDDKAMQEFHEMYTSHRRVVYRKRVVSDSEMKMLEMYKQGKSFSQIAKLSHLSVARVRNSIMHAALTRA